MDAEPAAVPECASCRFFVRVAEEGGTCRRFPPAPILTGMAPPRMVGQPPIPMVNTFPAQVPNDYWCGEHVVGVAPEPGPLKFDLKRIDLGRMMQPQEAELVGVQVGTTNRDET